MDWRLKCAAMHVLSMIPGHAIHGLLQRVSGRYFEVLTSEVLVAYNFHITNFRRLPAGSVALEFGAGRNMLSPLLLSHAGASRVYAYDLDRIATVPQVNAVIRQLRQMLPGDWREITALSDLERYRIDYRAPGDARTTGLPDGSVNFVCSTSTLEHIPSADIRRILRECRRVLTSDGLMSHIIDYHDHYASADRSISRVHFYRYSERAWQFANPSRHYQNRLRHSDYIELFEAAGLSAVEQRALITPVAIDRDVIHERFLRYSDEDLAALNGFFVHQLGISTPVCPT